MLNGALRLSSVPSTPTRPPVATCPPANAGARPPADASALASTLMASIDTTEPLPVAGCAWTGVAFCAWTTPMHGSVAATQARVRIFISGSREEGGASCRAKKHTIPIGSRTENGLSVGTTAKAWHQALTEPVHQGGLEVLSRKSYQTDNHSQYFPVFYLD
ncbi:hypothetical protein D3C73_1168730 [compost metagenome]